MITPSQDDVPHHVPVYRSIPDVERIIRLEGKGTYSLAYLLDCDKPILMSYTLKRFEEHLPTFIRIHRSALINPAYILQVSRTGANLMYVRLITGESIPVSRRQMTETLFRLNSGKST